MKKGGLIYKRAHRDGSLQKQKKQVQGFFKAVINPPLNITQGTVGIHRTRSHCWFYQPCLPAWERDQRGDVCSPLFCSQWSSTAPTTKTPQMPQGKHKLFTPLATKRSTKPALCYTRRCIILTLVLYVFSPSASSNSEHNWAFGTETSVSLKSHCSS